MKQLSEEFISARMEALEEVLRDNEKFQMQTKELHKVSHDFRDGCGMSKQGWGLYENLEEAFVVNNILYSQAAYKLGYSDGFAIGKEQKPEGRTLSLEDMTNLIAAYDCVQRLKEILLGDKEECWEGGGFAVFQSIYGIIEHVAATEIRLFGEDEVSERVTEILDREVSAEERAKLLLGII